MPLRPLGTVKEILESAGMNISYAYEDLVFLDHNAFLLQFTDKEQEVLIHINEEAVEDEIVQDLALLQQQAEENKMVFSQAGYYRLSQADEENINIEFLGTETGGK
ncbi:MAG: hypothetical protein JKY62_03550 [Desulfocapsa sp.]|uniref:Uncharacterized protein n=1 Tax=Desulfotalea psychrophila TaxID=84980 RepID=A0ABS3AUD0_9BACT|nr:hypothetical protein [Desulfocapsa sp.]MBN4048944.1 hypothetical protein [bacterium AH-315-N22]MBN4068363.1 hypothetical protein [Desulfotalea psychrophila]